MKRQLLVAKFGKKDRPAVTLRKDEARSDVDLVDEDGALQFGLKALLDEFESEGLVPSEVGMDLMLLGLMIYALDTRVSRDQDAQDGWTRELRLVLPVARPAVWLPTAELLNRMLRFLTGDIWTIQFRPRPKSQRPLVPLPYASTAFKGVTLFSGGLDSLIGSVDAEASKARLLMVSHCADGATSGAQDACFQLLEKAFPLARRLRLWTTIPKSLVTTGVSEPTTRGRSFLFLALAGLAASAILPAPSVEIRVPENGLIALNVPLEKTRLGALSTRTTHPHYLGLWNQLLKSLSISADLRNPYWDKTKGEMLLGCHEQSLIKRALPESMSCASPTKGRWKGLGVQHCGFCLPCIIRRAAIAHAFGRKSDKTDYFLPDLWDRELNSMSAEGVQVRAFQVACARLRANPGISRFLIRKPGPIEGTPDFVRALRDVYTRGMAEVDSFLDGAETAPL